MSVRGKESDLVGRLEFLVRRFFERIGGTIDFALRRSGPSRTDLSALTPQIERAIEHSLRKEESRLLAPHLIELRYDYETYTRIGQKRREYLEKELRTSAYEYIYNRRYATLAEVRVKITYDAFTIGLEVRVNFGEGGRITVAGGHAGASTNASGNAFADVPGNASGNLSANASGNASGGRRLDIAGAMAGRSCDVTLRGINGFLEVRACVAESAEPVGIGRNVANQIIIKDPTVSNFHAAFLLRPDGTLELADRGSANGTYVNGVLIGSGDRVIVRPDDRVRFGDVEMTLIVGEED